MLIDGNSLTYRAFFALPTDLATASGQVTNAVFGFTSMLVNLMRDHRPDQVIVAFDRPEPTFRHEAYDAYKAQREAAPDILRQQMGLVRQVVESLGVPIVELVGYEADDIIATLATQGRDRGRDVIIVTGDRDTYQLVEDPHVKVLYNRRGVSDYALYDEAGILERTGVRPVDYVPYAALRGDPSDNLAGAPGVGEKTAAKLVNTYGGIEGIYAHLGDQTPKLRENLAGAEDAVRRNLAIMVLLRDIPLPVDLDGLALSSVDLPEARRLYEFLEFFSLVERTNDAFGIDLGGRGAGAAVLEAEVTEMSGVGEVVDLIERLTVGRQAPLAIGMTDAGLSSGLALVTDGEQAEVAFIPARLIHEPAVVDALRSALDHRAVPVAAHAVKGLMAALLELGIDIRGLRLDTQIAAYLLDPAESRYLLDDLLTKYAGMELPADGAASEGQLDFDGSGVPDALTAARRALAVDRLVEPIGAALEAQGLTRLNEEIEVPLVRVLARMERVGVGVDPVELRRLRDHLAAEAERLRALVVAEAGEDFNVNSTKQLAVVLFENLGLAPQKKTKTGFSTDAAALEKLRGQHPVIDHLLDYREVEKLRSTYGEGLLAEVQPDHRIRATFNQTVARTGRLSSDAPNLHNIPVRSEMGRSFRRAFVADRGFELLVADYNQIELRCIAHLSGDPGLVAAFERGDDIHREVAARVFSVDPSAVTHDQRSKAKMVSYGLAYGMESYGLGQRLAIPTEDAALILEAYFIGFPWVKQYMEQTVAEARERGYTETLFGRRRRIPELASGNFRIRQAGERQAMNAGIQGLAADIFKVALVRLDRAIEEQQVRSRLILQVHDEVLLEVPPEEHDLMADMVRDILSHAFELRVPLQVDLAFGPTWADAKG